MNSILTGNGREIHTLPEAHWREHLKQAVPHIRQRLDFMTPQHHTVRNFVVTELARNHGKPIAPAEISRKLGIPAARVSDILAELEKRQFFLVRNRVGRVSWAFPVTSDRTAHRFSFSTGERGFAA